MIMKRLFYKAILAVTAPLMLNSCIEETFPTEYATAEQVGQSSVALEAMVNSIPTGMIQVMANASYHWDFGYPSVLISLSHLSGDVIIGGEDGYNWFYYWDQNYAMADNYVPVYQFWYNYYRWIKTCNDVVSSLAGTPEEELNADQRAFLGIALTYRAQYYLDLVRVFEPKAPTSPVVKNYEIPSEIVGLGPVIVTEATTPEQAANNPRATVADIYEQVIFADLNRAVSLLEGYEPVNASMPSQAVAYGVLARAYLERGSAGVDGAFASAAEYARKAIDASGCTPLTQTQWEDPINGFNSATSNNAWMWALGQTPDQVSNIISFIAHMSIENDYAVYGNATGRSIVSNLYNEIADDDFRKHSWLDPGFFDYYAYQSPRTDYKDWFLATYKGTDKTKAYGSIKFRPGQGQYTDITVGNAVDVPMMRVEEMYLIEAEALGAANLQNGINALNSFMQSHRQPTYSCTSRDFAAFQKEVAKQARIEFWGEGIPFWYCKRLELGIHKANTNCHVEDARFELDGVAPWWNLVIPYTEANSNPALDNMNNPNPTDTVDRVIE